MEGYLPIRVDQVLETRIRSWPTPKRFIAANSTKRSLMGDDPRRRRLRKAVAPWTVGVQSWALNCRLPSGRGSAKSLDSRNSGSRHGTVWPGFMRSVTTISIAAGIPTLPSRWAKCGSEVTLKEEKTAMIDDLPILLPRKDGSCNWVIR